MEIQRDKKLKGNDNSTHSAFIKCQAFSGRVHKQTYINTHIDIHT